MNAVIDEDLHKSLKSALEELGLTVFDVREHDLRGRPDDEVFQFAKKHKAVLFSGDLGFSNILDFPLGNHHGIVILRFPNEMSTALINEAVKSNLSKLQNVDYKGNLIIISPSSLRIRRHNRRKNQHMAVLTNKRNRSVSRKLKRAIAFAGWRRNISAKEKITAKELRSKYITLD